jgi:hypothetical protein
MMDGDVIYAVSTCCSVSCRVASSLKNDEIRSRELKLWYKSVWNVTCDSMLCRLSSTGTRQTAHCRGRLAGSQALKRPPRFSHSSTPGAFLELSGCRKKNKKSGIIFSTNAEGPHDLEHEHSQCQLQSYSPPRRSNLHTSQDMAPTQIPTRMVVPMWTAISP